MSEVNITMPQETISPVETARETVSCIGLIRLKNQIPTNLSDFNNDAGYLTNATDSLLNYYTKTMSDNKYQLKCDYDNVIHIHEELQEELNIHSNNQSNPHNVTKAQVGLDNVDNTSDADKPVSTAQHNAINAVLEEAKVYTNQAIDSLDAEFETINNTIGDIAAVLNSILGV